MEFRHLGPGPVETPVVVFGAWALGGGYWGARRDAAAAAALDAAFAGALPAVDTAPIYGFGHSEELVGQALARAPRRPLVFTKCGLRWDDPEERGELAFEGRGEGGRPVRVHRCSRPDSIVLECDRSLARLGVERIDLLQVHWPDPTTPIEDTMGALRELHLAGKVAAVGVSNYSAEQLERARVALGDVPLSSDQPRYSLVHREAEAEVLPWCLEHGVGTLVYSPLEQGLLTGTVGPQRTFTDDDARSKRPTFEPRARAVVNEILQRVVAPVAERLDASVAQVVLAWTIARPGVTAVLAGCRDPEQVRENARAGELVLEPEEWRAIDAAFRDLDLPR
ncbi:MAG: aldo/keto reductase [Planctomycetota bacterium]